MFNLISYVLLCVCIVYLGNKVRKLEEKYEATSIILANLLTGRLGGVKETEDGLEVVWKGEVEQYVGNKDEC